jgi:hypothetical protein
MGRIHIKGQLALSDEGCGEGQTRLLIFEGDSLELPTN